MVDDRSLLEKRVYDLVTHSELGCWDWNLLTNEIFWNEANYSLMGFEPFSVVPSIDLFMTRVHPDDVQDIRVLIQDCVNRNDIYQHQFRVIWPDGSIHWIVGTGRTTYDEGGVPVRMFGTTLKLVEPERRFFESHLLREKLKSLEMLNCLTEDLVRKAFEELSLSSAGPVQKLQNRIQEVLEVFRISLLEPRERLFLNEIIESVLTSIEEGVREQIRLRLGDPIPGHWQGRALKQALTMLIEILLRKATNGPIEIQMMNMDFGALIQVQVSAESGAGLSSGKPSLLENEGASLYCVEKLIESQGGRLKTEDGHGMMRIDLDLPVSDQSEIQFANPKAVAGV